MKTGKYYYDVLKNADVPIELIPYIPEQVYNDEELERHTSIARMKIDLSFLNELKKESFLYYRIKLLLDIAYENYATYKKIYDNHGFNPKMFKSLSDTNLIPYISKSDLFEIYEEAIKNPLISVHHLSTTTGTTGASLSLINDIDSHNRSLLHILEMYENMLGEKLEDDSWIYSIYDETQLLSSILGKYRIFTVNVDAPLEIVAKHIRKLRPKVVSGYASRIINLIKYLPDAKEIGIKLFTTNSEYSSPYERKMLSQRVGVPILDEYSSEELLIMGWETIPGKYYLPQDFSYIEFIKLNSDQPLSIVGTNIWDLTMPRIRYIQGDYVEKFYTKNGKIYFENLMGKEDYLIVNGKKIFPSVIIRCIDSILYEQTYIIDYQLVQNISGNFIFYYSINQINKENVNEYKVLKQICDKLKSVLGIYPIEFIKKNNDIRSVEKKIYIKRMR